MNLKLLAVDVIAKHGNEDVDWLTFSETIWEEAEERNLKLSDDKIEKLTQKLATLVNSAEVIVRWDGNKKRYSISN